MTEPAKLPSADHLKASVKEAIGKLIGDTRVEAEGRRQKQAARPHKPAGPRDD
ncbi:CsbD family protein [Methylobacterium sp. J-048]|uniref:CsbD family protein n=1 Tax=Methylobacterium sp. J-048 TaxID=2836635 RepID=UPI001FB87EB2|nr:CsbD family protein [Methylobacterium sp. J-048]MCJ2056441.1 CsbD family protein [Methylobacterium sp. J-048]